MYLAEGLEWAQVSYEDNEATIQILHAKGLGVLPMLDDETKHPKGSDTALAKRAQAALQSAGHEQSYTAAGIRSTQRGERVRQMIKRLFSDGVPHFTVTHFAGDVRPPLCIT